MQLKMADLVDDSWTEIIFSVLKVKKHHDYSIESIDKI